MNMQKKTNNISKTNQINENTCKVNSQWDAKLDPKHCYHVHQEFRSEEFHACTEQSIFITRENRMQQFQN